MFIRSKNSGRKAILTNMDRIYLKGQKDLTVKNRSKLFRKLDDRFTELFKDLAIIKRSAILDVWKSSRSGRLFHHQELILLQQVFESARPVHLGIIRHWTKKKTRWTNVTLTGEMPGKKSRHRDTIHYFWLDNSPHLQIRPRIDKDSLEPRYILRKLNYQTKTERVPIKIKTQIVTIELGKMLVDAYLKGYIPTTKEKACTVFEMNKKVSEEIIPFDQFKKDKPEIVKIKKILDRYHKRVNKALEPHNAKVYAMPYEFD